MKAVIIRPDETVEEITLDDDGGALADMQAAVGGYIEPVRTIIPHAQAWVNEEGIPRRLEMNRRASILAERGVVGNMLITGPVDDNGDETDCPMGMVEFVKRNT